MKIKTLIKELQKCDTNMEIKIYPKYVSESDTFKRHKLLKRNILNYCENDIDGKWVEIRF